MIGFKGDNFKSFFYMFFSFFFFDGVCSLIFVLFIDWSGFCFRFFIFFFCLGFGCRGLEFIVW